MTTIATERPTAGTVRAKSRRRPAPGRFYALEGTVRVAIEVDSEDDARCLCREMQWEFIGLCHG